MAKEDDKEDDLELFRRAVADARPLRAEPRVTHAPRRPDARPLQRERDERAVLDELLLPPPPEHGMETGEELLFLRPGYQHRYLRRLRRGTYSVADELDLHGMNEQVAGEALKSFISECAQRGLGCVKVIHGKGLRSRGQPKLKRLASRLLRRHPAVIAFSSCRPVDGGTGAVAGLLRRR
ncbi:MAG: Smr/MutS family protein [Gammaproteobacteria bacterium]